MALGGEEDRNLASKAAVAREGNEGGKGLYRGGWQVKGACCLAS